MTNEIIFDQNKDDPADILEQILNVKERIAVFNKVSGELAGMHLPNSEASLNSEFYKWKLIEIDEKTQKWVGDYDNGKVVDVNSQPIDVSETAIDHQAEYTIRDIYDYHHQINNLVGVVRVMIEKNNLKGEEVNAFLTMADYIQERRDANERYKKAYQDGPDFEYVSKEDERRRVARLMEGGVHEAVGPASESMPHAAMRSTVKPHNYDDDGTYTERKSTDPNWSKEFGDGKWRPMDQQD
jgi:hypothetical protein